MNFEELLLQARAGEKRAMVDMLELYRPMLIKASILNSSFDEDLYQELCIVLLKCIRQFRI
ncbi:helix-turn-helix domain-containing protein [Lacrimispora amygdalina]|uniref:Helix-turn-helix domain-containing protein n=1 Tax=Lacrimispora amygdalina TaxID=253257 RepID=A0A3E2N9I2_9FIRM|nr:helix-turn-helix domain-containing protein [Clostridium indicum]RFZ77584.1 helix-turn-helix domain-containing protein [Clostridium indicum]